MPYNSKPDIPHVTGEGEVAQTAFQSNLREILSLQLTSRWRFSANVNELILANERKKRTKHRLDVNLRPTDMVECAIPHIYILGLVREGCRRRYR